MTSLFVTLVLLDAVALISPGPDFLLVSKLSRESRSRGIMCVLGINIGITIHVLLSFVGISALITEVSWLMWGLKYLAAAYFVYLGLQMILSKKPLQKQNIPSRTKASAFWLGLGMNLVNPKAFLFMVGVATLALAANPSMFFLVLLGITLVITNTIWFLMVALALSSNRAGRWFQRGETIINRIFGSLMVFFGYKLATSE